MIFSIPAMAKVVFLLQVIQASVGGVVLDDETGQPLFGAVVSLPDLDPFSLTDTAGQYFFADVPPGPQHLSVQHLGYRSRVLHALVPREGRFRLNVSLRPDPIPLAGVKIWSRVPIRGSEPGDSTGFPDRGISGAAIRTHPLLPEPDVLQALGGGEVVMGPETPSGIHVRGGASDQTAYLLDGIPVFSPYHSGGLFGAWNPDAIAALSLYSSFPSGAYPDALSGVVSAATRPPGIQLRGHGGLSTSHARLTLDGPVGSSGIGFLISLRTGFPGGLLAPDERSYLRGESGDRIAKLEGGLLGGRFLLLAYDTQNEMDASAVAGIPETDSSARPRNTFRWDGRSIGLAWTRRLGGWTAQFKGWSASGHAGSTWGAEEGSARRMVSERTDLGMLFSAERGGARGRSTGGLRIDRSRTSYRVATEGDGEPFGNLAASTPTVSAFLQHGLTLGSGLEANLGATLTFGDGAGHLGPRAQLSWSPDAALTLSASAARTHQYSQSLRNSESVAGNVFPADLFLGAAAEGVPVARSDQGILAVAFQPAPGLSFGAQAYLKSFRDLLLVAPLEKGVFSTGVFATGSGSSGGVALEGSVSTSRVGFLGSYGWQRVRLEHEDRRFVPEWGSAHLVDAGVILFPTLNSSLRIGAAGAMGRHSTAVNGVLEWEACNLLDKGCEFGGTPELGDGPLGATRLPAYFRLDVTLQNHWHLRVARVEGILSVFGSFTNLLGRKNLLTFATDPSTGQRVGIEMRPLAPLVFGIDWGF